MENNTEKQNPKPEYNFTFKVFCSFEMEYTFSEDEVERDLNVRPEDADPTDAALEALERELGEHLSQLYPGIEVDASADSASLLAVFESDAASPTSSIIW